MFYDDDLGIEKYFFPVCLISECASATINVYLYSAHLGIWNVTAVFHFPFKATVERTRHCTTTLVGEDTDLLILLLHYSKADNEIIYFLSDANKQSKEHRVYNINLLKEALGDDVCNELLFVHAYSSCDSTSRICGIGKKSAFRKLVTSDPVMKFCASAFILQKNLKRTYQILAKT